MSFGLRLWLLLLIAGCAEQALVVADSDWMTVPDAQRAAIDHKQDADVAAARTEFASAQASLAAMPHTQPVPTRSPVAPSAAVPAAGNDGDPWASAQRDHEHARVDARGRVDAAAAEVQRSDLAWRQIRVESAEARLALVVSQRELIRAQAVNRNMRGEDTYDAAPMRGQFSRAQQRWYALAQRERAARDAFAHASADLASQKEAYAQIMRGAPLRAGEPDITADDHSARLALDGWSISRSDIRRRRGLRHLLDDAIAAPQLRQTTYLLRPAGGPAGKALPPAPPTASASTTTSVAASAPARPPASAATSVAASAPARAPASAAAPPAAPVAAPAYEHPADRAAAASPPARPAAAATAAAAPGKATSGAPSTAMSSARPAAPAPRSAAPPPAAAPVHPADRAAAAMPAPMATAASTTARPAGEPARAAPAASRPESPAAAPQVAAGARPTERTASPAAAPNSAAAASRPGAPPATSAAKPVEHTLSDAESHRP